ncbi:MAG: class I SAM-dependent methyltransferase [Deltaproteobacteria bacterium]|nr:class I SAM-dependent methyltransferase [Deltaproteobacteria bacterium]
MSRRSVDGELLGRVYPGKMIRDGVVDLDPPAAGYLENFGVQWQRYRDTQLDSKNGTTISHDFLVRVLGSPLESLRGKTVLEIGAGAGRFSEHLAEHARLLICVDSSDAIWVNAARGRSNVALVHGDLFTMPAPVPPVDLVLCRGVLQHTPDPPAAIHRLHQLARPGGEVVFDIYGPGRLGRLEAKYLWRRVVPRVFAWSQFEALLRTVAEPALRMRWRVKPLLPGRSKRVLDYFIPIWDYKGVLPLGDAELVEWAILDTLDALYAVHDHPMTAAQVLAVIEGLACDVVSADTANNFFRTRLR